WFCPHLHLHSFPTRRSSDLREFDLKIGGSERRSPRSPPPGLVPGEMVRSVRRQSWRAKRRRTHLSAPPRQEVLEGGPYELACSQDRKSTRLNSSHVKISYAV